MISKVTESNKNLVDARLAKINEALAASGSSTVISDFQSYFGNIVEISKLKTNFHNAEYKYFLMPVDEPFFEIDANKRTITVPSDFQKNGVGVRGDHQAETLYFRIDQYFDHQNLFDVDEIIINWQIKGEKEIHTSLALAPDDTYDPGHIVFGWVIEKDMTPAKGSISFSVAFVKASEGKYIYALNTLPASVNINDSLVLEDPSILASLKRPVFERLTDSRFSPDGVIPPADPTFRSGEKEEDKFLGLPKVANFTLNADGTEAEKLILTTIGVSADTNNVKYSWEGTEFASGERKTREPNSPSVLTDFVETNDIAPVDGINYYTIENGEATLLEGDAIAEAFDDETVIVYEAGSSFEVTASGTYSVNLQAQKEISQSSGPSIIAKSGNVISNLCTVPAAAVPSIEISAVGYAVPAENQDENFEEKSKEFIYFTDSKPVIKAAIGIDSNKLDEENGIVADSSLGAIAIQLAAKGSEAPSNFADMTYAVAAAEMDVNNAAISLDAEGEYEAFAVNRRNHTYAVSEASNVIKTSRIAPAISNVTVMAGEDIVLNAGAAVSGAEVVLNDANGHKATLEASIGSIAGFANGIADLDAIKVEAIEIKDDPAYHEEDGDVIEAVLENNKFIIEINNDPGEYKIRVTARYHGTIAVAETAGSFSVASR